MATLDQYLVKLQALRKQHAWETLTQPQTSGRPLGEAYSYAIGFQSGLEKAEKLIRELLEADKKGDEK